MLRQTKTRLLLLLAVLTGALLALATIPAFDNYQWQKRPLLLFSPSETHSQFIDMQIQLANAEDGILERDIIIGTFTGYSDGFLDNMPLSTREVIEIRNELQVAPKEFTIILIGKDGLEKFRHNKAVKINKIFREIDNMPMRRREIRGY